jgi:hypothetical protein
MTQQLYIGTKIISAMPMSREDYNTYRGWQMPSDEDGTDAGYLIEYLDGGSPNDSRHTGYISWSPAAQFEEAYLVMKDAETLLPYQQRVVGEYTELRDRVDKLKAFRETQLFQGLPLPEQNRLSRQFTLMCALSQVLMERIAAF